MEEGKFFKEFLTVPTRLDGFIIYHELEETTVDGKVATILSEGTDATTSCSICGLSSSNLNNLEKVYRVAADLPDIKFKHGLSNLHLWIRSMECFLHIANWLDFKKWQARGENKELLKLKQKQIQVALRGGLDINVDVRTTVHQPVQLVSYAPGCTQDVGTQPSSCKYKDHSSWTSVRGATGVL